LLKLLRALLDTPFECLVQFAESRLALAQRGFGTHPLGGFADDTKHPGDRTVIVWYG
jgi:hypothetical protein